MNKGSIEKVLFLRNFCVKTAIETHLLQTGGVKLCLINDLYSHLEGKQIRVHLLLHPYSLITRAAVGFDASHSQTCTAPSFTSKHNSIILEALHTENERYNLTALNDKHSHSRQLLHNRDNIRTHS